MFHGSLLITLFAVVLAAVSAHKDHEFTPLYQSYKNDNKDEHFPVSNAKKVSHLNAKELKSLDPKLFAPPLPGQNGVDYHPQLLALPAENDTQIIYYSWHVHVYFFHEDQNVTDRSLALRDQFISAFSLGKCDDSCFMGGPFDTCVQGMCYWDANYGVDGPHPYGN